MDLRIAAVMAAFSLTSLPRCPNTPPRGEVRILEDEIIVESRPTPLQLVGMDAGRRCLRMNGLWRVVYREAVEDGCGPQEFHVVEFYEGKPDLPGCEIMVLAERPDRCELRFTAGCAHEEWSDRIEIQNETTADGYAERWRDSPNCDGQYFTTWQKLEIPSHGPVPAHLRR